jgi:hypothetical protein
MEDDLILNIFVDDPLTNNLVPFEYSLDLKKSKTKFSVQKTNYQINLQTAISNAIVSQAPNVCVRLKNSNKPQIISHKPDK